jgi:hypothetical protein
MLRRMVGRYDFEHNSTMRTFMEIEEGLGGINEEEYAVV